MSIPDSTEAGRRARQTLPSMPIPDNQSDFPAARLMSPTVQSSGALTLNSIPQSQSMQGVMTIGKTLTDATQQMQAPVKAQVNEDASVSESESSRATLSVSGKSRSDRKDGDTKGSLPMVSDSHAADRPGPANEVDSNGMRSKLRRYRLALTAAALNDGALITGSGNPHTPGNALPNSAAVNYAKRINTSSSSSTTSRSAKEYPDISASSSGQPLDETDKVNRLMPLAPSETCLEKARQAFASERLQFPPLPGRFASTLDAESDHLFVSGPAPVPYGPYSLTSWAFGVGANTEAFAVAGFDGGGFNSWAAHYFVVEGPLGLFVQENWGGIYMDADKQRSLIAIAFDKSAKLQAKILQAQNRNLIPSGQRLVVIDSPICEHRCYWVKDVEGIEGVKSVTEDLLPAHRSALDHANLLLDKMLGGGEG